MRSHHQSQRHEETESGFVSEGQNATPEVGGAFTCIRLLFLSEN